jgi:hypothetical protein
MAKKIRCHGSWAHLNASPEVVRQQSKLLPPEHSITFALLLQIRIYITFYNDIIYLSITYSRILRHGLTRLGSRKNDINALGLLKQHWTLKLF